MYVYMRDVHVCIRTVYVYMRIYMSTCRSIDMYTSIDILVYDVDSSFFCTFNFICMHSCMHSCMHGWMHGWMVGWMVGWLAGCLDAWMGGWVGWMNGSSPDAGGFPTHLVARHKADGCAGFELSGPFRFLH